MPRRILAAAFVALALPGAGLASCDLGMTRPFNLASGNWGGTPWKLRAIDSGDGRYGVTVIVAGSRRANLGGRFYLPGRNGAPVEFGWTSSVPGSQPRFLAGVVTEAAHQVQVNLSDRSVRKVRTILPRCGLSPGISFFVVRIPRGTHPTFFSALNAAGKIVAKWRP